MFFSILVYSEEILFPRLGMWWLDAEKESSEKIARYDLLLNEFEFDDGFEKIRSIRKINAFIKIFRPISPTEINWKIDGKINPVVNNLPSSFFLQKAGSVLVKPVDRRKNELQIKSVYDDHGMLMYHKGATVIIGEHESALITRVDTKRNILKVKRGYIREAADHQEGERVAEHVVFWPETWVMNNTADCRRKKLERFEGDYNWLEFYFTLITQKDHPYLKENFYYINQDELRYDGIIIDRFDDHQSWLGDIIGDNEELTGKDLINLDLYQNNGHVTMEVFDRSWLEGTDQLLHLLRKKYPGLTVIRNNSQSVRFEYDGQVYETAGWSFPTYDWWEKLFLKNGFVDYYPAGSYLEWFEKKKDAYVMVEVYEDDDMPDNAYFSANPFRNPGFKPDYKRMRFSLASTLLGDGYYSYEANTSLHGAGGLLWFDEYDNAGAGKGYLGYPTGKYERMSNGIFKREFDNGLVLVNPNKYKVEMKLGKKYKKIKGRQVEEINDGSITDSIVLEGFDGIILLNE